MPTRDRRAIMRIGTRLLLVLLPSIGIIMLAYGLWALAQRESVAKLEIREDTETFAAALGLAIGYAISPTEDLSSSRVLGEVHRGSERYSIAVYDLDGRSLYPIEPGERLIPSERLESVITTGRPHRLEGGESQLQFSILVPIRDRAGITRGVLEVTHPLTLLESERSEIQRRFALNTLTLILAVGLVTWGLVHRSVSQPLARFVDAARAVGGGNLKYRLDDQTRIGELNVLAGEFNRMAGAVDAARAKDADRAKEQLSLERRLRQAEKAATVGKLSAGLAHEIAAPLNVISGRAELLRTPGATPEAERNITIIIHQIQRITGIVRSLLNYAGHRTPTVRPMDLAQVLSSAVEFLEPEFSDAGIEVRLDVADRIPLVADKDLLHEVFVNLLLNAAQALQHSDQPRRVAIRCTTSNLAAGDNVTVDIVDTGPGIAPGDLQRVFDPFFTTKTRGTGLGLFMCRSIVEEHGGTLQVVTDTERGAHFRMTLPLEAAPVATNG